MWIEKMKKAMQEIKGACTENGNWGDCWKCPFKEYCDILEEQEIDIPETWNLEDKKKENKNEI